MQVGHCEAYMLYVVGERVLVWLRQAGWAWAEEYGLLIEPEAVAHG